MSICFCVKNANAQLWSYIGDTPAKEKAAEKYLQKEAFTTITRYTPDEDRFQYNELIYHLQSLDAAVVDVHIMQVPFTHTLSITTSTDSLKIEDCNGPDKIHLLAKNLLEIVYSPRGGSDDGYNNVLLLAVSDSKFRIAMEIESLHDWDTPNDFGLSEVHLIFTGQTPKNYQLAIKTHNLLRSERRSKNFDRYHTYSLKYDNNLNIFYTGNKHISVKMVGSGADTNMRKVEGVFPVIALGDIKYCYINEFWYSVGRDWQSGETILYNDYFRPKSKP